LDDSSGDEVMGTWAIEINTKVFNAKQTRAEAEYTT
jgi:hypothetical protein